MALQKDYDSRIIIKSKEEFEEHCIDKDNNIELNMSSYKLVIELTHSYHKKEMNACLQELFYSKWHKRF